MISPADLANIESAILFNGIKSVPAGEVLAIIGRCRLDEAEIARLRVELGRATVTLDNVRTVIGGGELPAEWAPPWRLRAQRAERQLVQLAGVRDNWRRQLAAQHYQLAADGSRLELQDTAIRRAVLEAVIGDVNQILHPETKPQTSPQLGPQSRPERAS